MSIFTRTVPDQYYAMTSRLTNGGHQRTTMRVVAGCILVLGLPAMLAAGVLIYAGVGVAGIVLGGNYLDYFVLSADPVAGQHRGIFWVEVGVAVTVAGVMLKIFYMFGGRGQDPE